MNKEELAWEIMRDHYRTLYFCSPGFRETVNWKAMTYSEMLHGDFWFHRGSRKWNEKQEAFVRKQHEKGVTALESFVQSVEKERPALAAERRHKGAEAVMKTLTIEERRAYRDIMWARYNSHRQIRTNWYRKNQDRIEGSTV